MINYGEEFKYHRIKAGLSQNKLAKLTGIKQQNISNWESEKKEPSISNCAILADFYGISIDELIGRDYKTENKKTTINNSFNNSNITGDIKF